MRRWLSSMDFMYDFSSDFATAMSNLNHNVVPITTPDNDNEAYHHADCIYFNHLRSPYPSMICQSEKISESASDTEIFCDLTRTKQVKWETIPGNRANQVANRPSLARPHAMMVSPLLLTSI